MAPRRNRAARKLEAEIRRKQLLREHLAREVKLVAKSLARGEPGWIEKCSKLRLEELRRQFRYDMTKGQRLLDQKNSFIEKLLQLKVEATELYDRRVRQHEQQMDFMIGFFQLSQYRMTAWYMYDQTEYFRKGLLDQHAISLNFQRADEYFLNHLHKSNEIALNTLHELKQKFLDRKTDIIDNLEYTRFRTYVRWVDSLMAKEGKKAWINEMLDEKEKKWKLYADMSAEIEMEYAGVSKVEVEIGGLMEEQSKLRNKLLIIELENARQITELQNQRNYLIRLYWDMKKPPTNDAVEEKTRSVAGKAMTLKKRFGGFIHRGKVMLTLAGICRKYETQMETIVCTYSETEQEANPEIEEGCVMDDFTEIEKSMRKFRHRINQIVTQNLELAEQKHHLFVENKRLQNLLRQYWHQQKLTTNMQALRLNQRPGVKIPVQEASTMPQLRALSKVPNKLSL